MFWFAAAALGAIFGSFINALSFRFKTGVSIVNGRSRCMRCGHSLHALDLVPVLSYVALRGRCRYCGVRISMQYPVVELVAAGLALAVYAMHPTPAAFGFWLLVWMVLLFVVVYDLRHFIIPWSCSILLAALALGWLFFQTGTFEVPGIWALLAGPLLALPLFLFSLVSGGTWMGWGDGALQLSLGWFLGLAAGIFGLLVAFWAGACVGIALMLMQRGFTMKSEVPFAPFLILGAAAAHFLYVDFLSFFLLAW